MKWQEERAVIRLAALTVVLQFIAVILPFAAAIAGIFLAGLIAAFAYQACKRLTARYRGNSQNPSHELTKRELASLVNKPAVFNERPVIIASIKHGNAPGRQAILVEYQPVVPISRALNQAARDLETKTYTLEINRKKGQYLETQDLNTQLAALGFRVLDETSVGAKAISATTQALAYKKWCGKALRDVCDTIASTEQSIKDAPHNELIASLLPTLQENLETLQVERDRLQAGLEASSDILVKLDQYFQLPYRMWSVLSDQKTPTLILGNSPEEMQESFENLLYYCQALSELSSVPIHQSNSQKHAPRSSLQAQDTKMADSPLLSNSEIESAQARLAESLGQDPSAWSNALEENRRQREEYQNKIAQQLLTELEEKRARITDLHRRLDGI